MMNSTIKDVAQHAGVSVATASRALTGHPNVSAKARALVEGAAASLGYQPDQVARSLRRRPTRPSMVVSTIGNVFFTEVAHAAEQAAHRHGYNLIVCNTNHCQDLGLRWPDGLTAFLEARVSTDPAFRSRVKQLSDMKADAQRRTVDGRRSEGERQRRSQPASPIH